MSDVNVEDVLVGGEKHLVPEEGGVLCVEDSGGQGEVVLCLPSLGDVRQEYRFLAPLLVQAGYRVLVADLRGFGESSAEFAEYSPEAVGRDVLAILEHCGVECAQVVGCSLAAGAGVWAATEAPERISALVMLGGIVRDLPADKWFRPMSHLMFARPWGAWLWGQYFRKLLPGQPPSDLDGYIKVLCGHLKEPGRLEALGHYARASKTGIASRLADVRCPTLAIVGGADIDFADPAAELVWMAEALGGEVQTLVCEGAGHYPHVEQPEIVMQAWMKTRAQGWSHAA